MGKNIALLKRVSIFGNFDNPESVIHSLKPVKVISKKENYLFSACQIPKSGNYFS